MSKTLLTARTGVRRGKIELAHGGTIFFRRDRRCLSGTSTQALALPPGTGVRARGGVTPISVDVRIIAATNRNLERSIKEGLFRADLYYRLNVVAISLPPLRERREDITPLSQYFLRKDAAAIRRNVAGIAEEGQKKLEAYEWPGNVRELANVIERAVVLGWDSTITLEDLPNRITAARTTAGTGKRYRTATE